ncbi:putative leucine-rich repeat-containing protein DDB_G0290503 [Scleropages formosus]|uniref:Putative leucine-rich repeat-containing protein DDB_G0290503 n=1 Tax=Scleropages formosus TaxID=113540 RepID=A0A8D0CE33_SCLFO|nr:putative leucine-rich repeat-containing protein DDB_G0290503 [Scleropages formosus]
MGGTGAFPFSFIFYSLLLQNTLCRNVFPTDIPELKMQNKRETIIEHKHVNITINVVEEDGGTETFVENCQEVQKKLDQKINELDEKTNVNSELALRVALLQAELQKAQREGGGHPNVLKKQLQETILQLERKNAVNADLAARVDNLQNLILELQKWATDRASAQVIVLQTELQNKITELKEKSNDNSKLYLQILTLQKQMKELESGSSAQISDLQDQLQRTAEQLRIKKRQLEVKTGLNYRLVQQILDLQNSIWELQKGYSDKTTLSKMQMAELLKQLEEKINQLEDAPDDDSKLVLKIFSLESRIRELQLKLVNETIPDLIAEIQQKLDKKNKELEETLKELENRKNDNSNLLLQIVNLTRTVENLQKQDTSKSLMSQVTELQNKLQSMDKGFFELQASHNAIQKQLGKTTADLQNKNNENSRLASEINRLKKLMADVEKEAEERRAAEVAGLQNEVQKAINSMKETANDNSKMVMQILSLQSEINHIKSGSSDKIKDLEQKLKEKTEQLMIKTKQLEKKTNLNSELVQQILELQGIIWDLERGGTNGTTRLFALLKQLENKVEEVEVGEGDNTKLVLKIFALESVIREITRQSMTETSPSVFAELQEQLKKKNKELEDAMKELERNKNDNSKILVKIVEMQENLGNLQRNISNQSILGHFAEMKRQLEEMNVKYKNLLASYNEVQKLLEESTNELKNVTSTNVELELEVNRLKNRLVAVETEVLQQGSVKIATLQNELERKIQELEQKDNDNSKLFLEILTLRTQINNIKSGSSADIKELQRLLQEKTKQLSLKTKQLEVKTDLNSKLTQQILELQGIIWDLEKGGTGGTAQLSELLKQLEGKINQMDDTSDDDSKLVLKIFALETIIRETMKESSQQTSPAVIAELEKKLQAKNKELEETVKELQSRNNENSKMLTEIVGLHKTVKTLEKEAVDHSSIARNAELQKALEDKDEQYRELKKSCGATQRELQDTRDQLDKKMSASSKLVKEVNELKDLLSAANNDQTSAQIAVLKNELQGAINQLKEKSDDNSKLVLQIYTLQSQVKTLQTGSATKVKELQELLRQKAKELKDKNKQLEVKTDLNSKLVMQILELQGIIWDLEKGGTNGTSRLFDLLDQLEQKVNQMEDKPEDDTKLVLKIFALQNIIKELLKQSESTPDNKSDKANIELQKKLDAKNKELAETVDKLKQKDNENTKMLVRIVDLETTVRQVQEAANNQTMIANIAELKEQLKDMDERHTRLQSSYNGLETQLIEKEKAYSQLHSKYKDLLRKLEDNGGSNSKLQRQLKDQEDEKNQLQAKLSELQRQFTQKNEDCSQLQSRYDGLQNQMKSQNDNLSRLQATYNELQKQVKDKEKQYSDLKNRYDDLQKQVKEKNEHYEHLQDKYNEVQNEVEEKENYKFKTPAVFLDPDTAHPKLILSEDGKEVRVARTRQDVPSNPFRFDTSLGVVGKKGFTSGKSYWEVQVGERSCYILGVIGESATRKGRILPKPRNKYWTVIKVRQNVFRVLENAPKNLNLSNKPNKVGVLLDYEGGKVSFYDTNTRSHIYTFSGNTFSEKLFPVIITCEDTDPNEDPIVMSSVSDNLSWIQ